MAGEHERLIEIDKAHAAVAAFVEWAGEDAISVYFTPDTLMGVNRPGRRGWLWDEIYFHTAWIAEGADEFIAILTRHSTAEPLPSTLAPPPGPAFSLAEVTDEPSPDQTLELVLTKGSPLAEVRHLL